MMRQLAMESLEKVFALNGAISPLRVYAAFDDVFRWDKHQPAVARDLLMVGAILINGSTGTLSTWLVAHAIGYRCRSNA